MEFTYERIEEGFCERAHLIEWNVSALLERGKFLPLLHSWTAKKFCCSANFAVSSKTKSIAVIASDGELNIMQVKDDKLILKSQVRVLSDPYPEFRLIEWNSTETLLFATRSSAVMDVFEANGMFLYKIPMLDDVNGSLQIISQIRPNPLNDEIFSDDVYTLQIDGTFAAFRVGKEAYHRLFTVNLGCAPLCSMAYVSKYNILISCGEFQQSKQSETGMDSASFGMNVHRIVDGYPYVDLIKPSVFKKAWHQNIPFLSDKKSIVICAEISPDQNTLLAVTSTGELLQFALPSLRLLQSATPYSSDEKTVPIQVSWISEESFIVLHSNGQITRAKTDEYFNGNFIDYKLNHLENCKRIHALDDSTTYALTEVRLDNIVTPEENKQRVGAELSLFVIFHLSFLLKILKAFFSFFFGGDATRDLNENLGIEQSAQLSLFTTKNLSLSDYIDKCIYNRNYQLAITLAESSQDPYDLDIIYKRQWEDLKQSRSIGKEHLEVLRSVHDKVWVVDECLRLDIQTNISLHEDLLTLAAVVVQRVDNEKLKNRVLNASQILGIIRKGIPRDEDACELFLKFRNSTILTFCFSMAEETNFDLLRCLFAKYRNELRNYLLLILTAIPETTEPSKYTEFLPYSNEPNAPDGSFILNKNDDFLPVDISKIPAKFADYSEFILGQNDEISVFEKWSKQRVEEIDTISGLEEDCILFLRTVIDHGLDSLLELYEKYSFYEKFIQFSGSTTITFKQFVNSDQISIQSTLSSHMTKSNLLENLQSVVELIEFADKGRGKAVEQILSLVSAHSIRGFEALYALKAIRPGILTTENLIQCLICSEVTGNELTKAMNDLELPNALITVVEFCAQVKSDDSLTFCEIHSAINDSNKAAKLIQRYIHGNCVLPIKNKTDEWWRDLLTKSRHLRHSAFEKVVSDEYILKTICTEMLNLVTRDITSTVPQSRQAPFHLVVDLSGTGSSANISLLKQLTFEELIIEKSKDYLDSSIPDLDDSNLKRASIVLEALRTGARLPRLIAGQKRALDIIKLSLELGSKRVPATFTYCSREILLTEIVNTKNNYKNVKACAELAKLLELSTPSARTLAECASCAFKQGDIKTVKSYVQQLSKSAKDFPIIYEMAKSILENKIEDEELNDDAIACLIHNCQENELNNALEILSNYRNKSAQKSSSDSTDSAYPDPIYTPIKRLHLYDFDSVGTPLKIPLNTHQSDVLMSLENDVGAKERIEQNYELKMIVAALRVLQERGVHPYILENLGKDHYRQIAVKLAQYEMEDEDEI